MQLEFVLLSLVPAASGGSKRMQTGRFVVNTAVHADWLAIPPVCGACGTADQSCRYPVLQEHLRDQLLHIGRVDGERCG